MKKLGTIEEIMEAFEECAKERQELEDKINKAIVIYEEPKEILGDKENE